MKEIFVHVIFVIILLIILPLIVFSSRIKVKINKIKIYDKEIVFEMDVEEYVKCVVASEMPAMFEKEALKAQAVAARTFAYKKIYEHSFDNVHKEADVCANFGHCQAYNSKGDILKKWGDDSSKYWNKISEACDATKDLVICFKGDLILPVFHSNSVLKTESSKEIWANVDIPYLQSVETISRDEISITNVKISIDEFKRRISEEYPSILFSCNLFKDIKEIVRNESGRVRYLKISDVCIKGEKFRSMFGLKSTNFKIINLGDDIISIEVLGSGHGVGLSQVGANEMAKLGKTYQEILKHYYKGVNIHQVDSIK